MTSFVPASDIPDLSGKVIFITGGNRILSVVRYTCHVHHPLILTGNNGLGKAAALELSKHNPAHIFLGSRIAQKGNAAVAEIQSLVPSAKLTLVEIDLASFSSVKAAANKFLAASGRLDILMNNAGIMSVPASTTVDGYEIQFGTNHMGHALLTKLLLPTLLKTSQELKADVRIITLSSAFHTLAPSGGILFDTLHDATSTGAEMTRYGQSKLANILYSMELARRYPAITAVAVHPGYVNTGLSTTMNDNHFVARVVTAVWSKFSGVDAEKGARNQLWAATANGVESGVYYEPVAKKKGGSVYTRDVQLARKLWDWTETELRDW